MRRWSVWAVYVCLFRALHLCSFALVGCVSQALPDVACSRFHPVTDQEVGRGFSFNPGVSLPNKLWSFLMVCEAAFS